MVKRRGCIRDCCTGFLGIASTPLPLVRRLYPGRMGTDDHPFVSALYEHIHPTPVAAGVLPQVGSLLGDSALDHGNIVVRI